MRGLNEPKEVKQSRAKSSIVNDTLDDFVKFRDQLRQYFNDKVELKRNNKGIGKIVIPFNSDTELMETMGLIEKMRNL